MTNFAPTARVLAIAGLALAVVACATTRNAIVRAPARCADRTVQVYFDADSAQLTPEGRAVIAAAAGDARGCRVASVEVIGLADAAGAPGANLELSQKRAASVAGALQSYGLPAAEYKVAAAGQEGAVAADGKLRPMRRRADIVLHLATP